MKKEKRDTEVFMIESLNFVISIKSFNDIYFLGTSSEI